MSALASRDHGQNQTEWSALRFHSLPVIKGDLKINILTTFDIKRENEESE